MDGFCGLNCALCEVFIATASNDGALRSKIASLWSRQPGVCLQPEQMYCFGCRSNGQHLPCRHDCEIRICALARGIDCCRACADDPGVLFASGVKYLPYLRHMPLAADNNQL